MNLGSRLAPSSFKTTKGGSLEQSSLINEAVRNLKSHHLRGLHLCEYESHCMAARQYLTSCFEIFFETPSTMINSVNLKQVEVKENETAVDNLFIFTIMEINEEIDDAQTESQLRGNSIR